MTCIDLSHTITDGLITYKGLPAPVICDFLSREASQQHYADGTQFQIGKIEMVANTGTYIDSPFHRYPDGDDLAHLSLAQTANLEGILIHTQGKVTTSNHLKNIDMRGKAVLIHTGWDKHWNTDTYFENHPYLTKDAAQYLMQAGAALVGIDSLNIDDTRDGARPVHTILLGANIPIVEHLCNLDQLPESNFKFHAVPPKISGMGSFPVRAFAIV